MEDASAETWAGAPSTAGDGKRKGSWEGREMRGGEGGRHWEEAGRQACILWVRSWAGGEEKHKVKITFPTVRWQDNFASASSRGGFRASGVLRCNTGSQPVGAISGPADATHTHTLSL